MPKSKRGPALFEVYGKGQSEDLLPRAEERTSFARRTPARESASAFRATLTSLARSIGRHSDDDDDREMPEPAEGGPAVGIEGGKVHFALTSRGAGVVAFVVLVVVACIFSMGKWYGRQAGFADGQKQERISIQGAALDEIAQARQSEPIDGLFDGLGESPVTRVAAAQQEPEVEPQESSPPEPTALTAVRKSATTWVKGNTYVVVQSFRGDAGQDAVQAQEYLAQHGIETEIIGSSQRGFRLIATQGFNCKDATQQKLAERYITKIGTIGQAYFKSGGRYKLEGYFATLTRDTW